MSDIDFERALAEHQQSYQESEEYGTQWMPPDGNYITIITDVGSGTFTGKNSKKTELWWKLVGEIDEAGSELHGKEYQIGFYTTEGKKMGFLKGLVKALNKGISVPDLRKADKVFKNAIGSVLDVKVITTHDDRDNEYKNCYVQKILTLEVPVVENLS